MSLVIMTVVQEPPRLPRGERLCASTRKGATLEFGLKEQFLQWLLLERERYIKEELELTNDSGSRLHNWVQDEAYQGYYNWKVIPQELKETIRLSLFVFIALLL
jgi:hypothetical protein